MSYVGKPANRPIGTPTSISIPTGSSALAFLPDAPAISALHPIENTGYPRTLFFFLFMIEPNEYI